MSEKIRASLYLFSYFLIVTAFIIAMRNDYKYEGGIFLYFNTFFVLYRHIKYMYMIDKRDTLISL